MTEQVEHRYRISTWKLYINCQRFLSNDLKTRNCYNSLQSPLQTLIFLDFLHHPLNSCIRLYPVRNQGSLSCKTQWWTVTKYMFSSTELVYKFEVLNNEYYLCYFILLLYYISRGKYSTFCSTRFDSFSYFSEYNSSYPSCPVKTMCLQMCF